MLRMMFEADANVVDASPMYGRAEGVMGELLAETDTRNATFLATKVWTEGKDRGIAQMEESLRRLRADHIDLMQIHNLLIGKHSCRRCVFGKGPVSSVTSALHTTQIEVMETQDIDFV